MNEENNKSTTSRYKSYTKWEGEVSGAGGDDRNEEPNQIRSVIFCSAKTRIDIQFQMGKAMYGAGTWTLTI